MNRVRKPLSIRIPELARRPITTACGSGVAPVDAHLLVLLAAGVVDLRRQQDGQDRGSREDHERVAQRPVRPDHRRQDRDRRGDGRAGDAGQRDAGVGLDQAEVAAEPAGVRRLPWSRRTPWRRPARRAPRGTARASRRRSPRPGPSTGTPRIAMVAPIAQRRPWLNRSRNGPISGATIANGSIVRPQEERHLAAGLVVAAGHLEEQRAGQRDRDCRVAGGVEGVQLDQPEQAAVAGTLGVRCAAGEPEHPLTGAAGRGADGPGRPGGRDGRPGGATSHGAGPVAGVRTWRPGSRAACSLLVVLRALHASVSCLMEQSPRRDDRTSEAEEGAARPTRSVLAAVDDAREALLGSRSPAADVGDHLGAVSEAAKVDHPLLRLQRAGYRGWRWSVTVPAPRGRSTSRSTRSCCSPATTPSWPPSGCRGASGSGRATSAPATCSPPRRTTRGWFRRSWRTTSYADLDAVKEVADELGLGRARVLSLEGRELAAAALVRRQPRPRRRRSPSPPRASASPAASWSGWPGPLSQSFGVCANAFANDDGRVVSFDHGCGAHSEAQLHKRNMPQPLPEPVLDTLTWDDLDQF